MSTPEDGGSTASAAVAVAVASTTRRVPPPCWTEEETLALVNAYKEKWFVLRRGNLRAADWDAVAAMVSSSGGGTKSSIQCRHKIEKLRKRYRAEKQRCLNRPDKFSSSWDLFPLLDAMGFAPIPAVGSYNPDLEDQKNDGADGFRVKLKNFGNFDGDSDSNLDFGLGFGIKAANRSREKDYIDIYGDLNADLDLDHDLRGGFELKRKHHGNLKSNVDYSRNSGGGFGGMEDEVVLVPKVIGVKTSGKRSVADFGHGVSGFPVKTLGDRNLVPPRFKPKSYGKIDGNFSPTLDYDDDIDEMTDRGNRGSNVPSRLLANGYGRTDESYTRNVGSRVSNVYDSSSRSGYVKSNGNSAKGQPDLLEEVVSSVKMLTEMFVRVENTKMEMVREIEKTRMEMELKQCQMMLESQQQIVDAFAEALMEKKNKRKKAKVVVPPIMNGDCEDA